MAKKKTATKPPEADDALRNPPEEEKQPEPDPASARMVAVKDQGEQIAPNQPYPTGGKNA